jgi:hypothetical protein
MTIIARFAAPAPFTSETLPTTGTWSWTQGANEVDELILTETIQQTCTPSHTTVAVDAGAESETLTLNGKGGTTQTWTLALDSYDPTGSTIPPPLLGEPGVDTQHSVQVDATACSGGTITLLQLDVLAAR